MHTIIRSHTCLPAGSRLHDISQPPWLTIVSKSNKPNKPWLNIRSAQIQASPDEANTTNMLHDLSRPKPRNPVTRSPATRHHTPQLSSENLPRAASDSSLPDRLLGTRAALMASSSTDLQNLRFRPSSNLTRALTHL